MQRGTHQELIQQDGVYKKPILAQKDATEIGTSLEEVIDAQA